MNTLGGCNVMYIESNITQDTTITTMTTRLVQCNTKFYRIREGYVKQT